MLGRRILLVILIAAVSGLGFTLFLLREQTQVVIVKQPIAPLARIQAEAVNVVLMPSTAAHPHALHDLESVVGQYARAALYPGEQVIGERLSADHSALTFNVSGVTVPDGMVLASVAVDLNSSVGGLVRAGSLVNLVAIPKGAGAAATLFKQKAFVVAVMTASGQRLPALSAQNTATEERPPGAPAVVVLALKPKEALELNARESFARIVLNVTMTDAPDLLLPISIPLADLMRADITTRRETP